MPVFLFGCLFSLVWSSAFVAGKVSIDYVLPLNFLFFRFVSAGLLLLAVWAWLNRRQPFAGLRNRRVWLVGSLLGLLNYALYLGFSYTGLQTVSPQLVILLVATTPFITLLLSVLLGTRLHAKLLLAIAIGFSGVYIALSDKLGNAAFGLGVVWVLLGVAALSAGTLFYQRHAQALHPLPLIGIQNLVGGLLLLPFAEYQSLYAAMTNTPFVLSWLYQVIAISIVAMWMWFWLVRRIGSDSASVFHLMNPVFGILLSAAFFHTAVTRNDMIGTAVVIAGMALSMRWKAPGGRAR